jgi:outer membrane protein assembly factor BamB
MRASDGKRLWSSDNSPELRGLTIASNPAIAGRYVYTLGVDPGEEADRLVMLALDVTSGHVLWRSDVGTMARRGSSGRFSRARDPVLDVLDPWQNISAPCVDADTVYIAPNCGAVIAVDRFDGQVRWIRPYVTAGNAADQPGLRNNRRQQNVRVHEPVSTGMPRASVFRWNTTPVRAGSTIVVAPQDSDRVFALNARTGKNEWHTDSLGSATLFGAAGNLVYVANKSITALDTDKLESAWTWEGGAVGPAILRGNQIIVPTAGGLVTLNALDGAVVAGANAAHVPDVLALMKSEPIRAALQQTGALELLTGDDDDDAKKNDSDQPTPKGVKKRTR